MTINDILREKVAGVWAGTYTVLQPDGTVLERFDSRQEGRMEGTAWTERVTYLREGEDPYEHWYSATVDGDEVAFRNTNMWGETSRVGAEAVIFSFGRHERPDERIIEERRVPGALAVEWDPSAAGV
ncbi:MULTISPECIES: hypothetical protein [Mumia]|uniref:hypothetical protein n=1 Tax=Mumia TaxID=1546255 RepID=UPI001422E6F3|nr:MULTISPECIES: hypothetical protein [unclassified Mumia]QMW66255.1 hypothetical protein H4N58_19305 [Mumia sp. ZJ1417]